MSRLRGNSVDVATKKILKKINNYELSSGDVVSDLELSRELNMSRTPIREAILKLLEAGLLERTATKVVVKTMTLEDITEIMQVRESLELMSLRLIMNRGGLATQELKKLEAIQEKLSADITQGLYEDNFYDDGAFHATLVAFSGNSRIQKIEKQLSVQTKRLRWITLLTPGRYAETLNEHAAILDALKAGELANAEKAISIHLENTLANYTKIMNNKQWSKLMKELTRMNL